MRKILLSIAIVTVVSLAFWQGNAANATETADVEITKANFYAAWGMSTLQNLEIANNSNISLKNPEIEIKYKNSYSNEIQVAKITLPIEVLPHSKATYFKEGLNKLIVNPGGNAGMHTGKSDINIIDTSAISIETVKFEAEKSDINS